MRRWLWRLGALIFLAGVGLPAAQVAWVGWFAPWFTGTEIQRRIEKPGLEVRREWTPLEQMPPQAVWFVLVSEDTRFLDHSGVDWNEAARVVEETLESGKPGRGGSTISMQTARTLFLWQGSSWIYLRKALELYYTAWMEVMLSKRRILELYLNEAETGPGVFGLPAAAEHYFGRSFEDVTDSQAAYLAALLPNPRGWDPRRPSSVLRERQRRILRRAKLWGRPPELEALWENTAATSASAASPAAVRREG